MRKNTNYTKEVLIFIDTKVFFPKACPELPALYVLAAGKIYRGRQVLYHLDDDASSPTSSPTPLHFYLTVLSALCTVLLVFLKWLDTMQAQEHNTVIRTYY